MCTCLFKLFFFLPLPSVHLLDFCQLDRAPSLSYFALCCHEHVAPAEQLEDPTCGTEELGWIPVQKSRYGFIGSAVILKTFPGKPHKGVWFSQQQMKYTAANIFPSLSGTSMKNMGPRKPGSSRCSHLYTQHSSFKVYLKYGGPGSLWKVKKLDLTHNTFLFLFPSTCSSLRLRA